MTTISYQINSKSLRSEYIKYTIGYLLSVAFSSVLPKIGFNLSTSLSFALYVFSFSFALFYIKLTYHRLKFLDHSSVGILLFFIPVVNLALIIYLCMEKSKDKQVVANQEIDSLPDFLSRKETISESFKVFSAVSLPPLPEYEDVPPPIPLEILHSMRKGF